MQKVTKEQKQAMIEERKNGVSIQELTKKYGITYNYISFITAGAVERKSCANPDRAKRKTWRELHALVCHIAKLAGRQV